jgi:hypothetical protein
LPTHHGLARVQKYGKEGKKKKTLIVTLKKTSFVVLGKVRFPPQII